MSSLKDRIAAQRKAIADSRASWERPYKWKVGKTLIRVLPGMSDADDFSRQYGAHWIKDPRDESKVLAVVGDAGICYGKLCPVREAITDFIHRCNEIGDETSAKAAKGWLARESYVANVEVLGGADTENKGKVVRVEFSQNQYDAVLSAIDTMLMANPNFSMKDGIALVVERVGTGMQDTKYTFTTLPGNVPPPSPAILDQRMDLQSYVDSKFGISVTKALTHMSTLLGKDVTQTAMGQAIAANVAAPALAAPVEQTAPVTTSDDDVLAQLEAATVVDATFEDVAPATPVQTTVATAAPVDDMEKLLAEIDGL